MHHKDDILLQKIDDFRKKLYLKSVYKGLILFIILVFSAFVVFNVLEYYGNFNTLVRGFFFFSFITIALFATVKYLAIPSYQYFNKHKKLNDLKTAELMGKDFPTVQDKLVNYLQLLQQSNNSALALEAIKQKNSELKTVPFLQAIKLDDVFKYLKYSALPIALLLGIFLVSPSIFSEGSTRIINYNKTFVAAAPFSFEIKNKNLKTFQNEDFSLEVALKGSAFPENLYVEYLGRKIKLEPKGDNLYTHTFKNIQENLTFSLEGSGYSSQDYMLQVIQKPILNGFSVSLEYPSYIHKKSESLENVGNLSVPEGTIVAWKLNAKQTDTAVFTFGTEVYKKDKSLMNSEFSISKKILKSTDYTVTLLKSGVDKNSQVHFNIEVIKDLPPSIFAEAVSDTVLYKDINIGGNIKDDYGFSRLSIVYSITDEQNKSTTPRSIEIPIDLKNYAQNFYYGWNIDTLHIKPGHKLSYYLQVWDNDGVKGAKSAKTNTYELHMPDQKDLDKQIQNTVEQTEDRLDNSMSKATELQKEFEKLQNKIRGKKNLDWQDKKAIEDYIKKHDALKEDIQKLSELNKNLNEKQEKFKEEDLRIAEKAEKLQDLIQNIMDEETKKLWEDLQKMMQEKNKDADIQELLNKIDEKDESIEKELDRAMEFYKQLQFDRKLEENINKLQELAKEQKELSEKSNDKNADPNTLEKQQEQLNKQFEEVKKDLQEMKDINKSLENKHDLNELDQMEKDVEKEMKDAKEELSQGDKKDAQKKQKDASSKMQEMSDKMQKMKQSEEQEQHSENMDDLRQILENLLKLSFDQEELMKNLKAVNKSDPKYLQYGQEQLKLRDDAKIIEDSLFALSKRVPEIESFINKEVTSMKNYIEESSKLIKRREPYYAGAKQQAAMTSMNNLALMLDDVLRSMQDKQQQMNQDSKGGGGGSCKKPGAGKGPGKKGKKPSPGQMQDQLNKQMQDMMGGKSGTKMSEQLAKMAAQQEKIRRALQELENMRKGQGKEGGKAGEGGKKPGEEGKEGESGKNGNSGSGGDADKMMKEMEKIEEEIVNKRISPELIKRQKELTTRLLDFEKAVREREMEEKRESNFGQELDRPVPPSLLKYFSEKNKVTEMIRTVPPNLNPYYKKKVNDFFENLNP